MIRYLEHHRIDPEKWDAVIRADKNGHPYVMYQWLNCVSQEWCALVKDDYASVMPLPSRSKLGIAYIYQPVTCQQLGIFSKSSEAACLHEFLPFVPQKFRLIQLGLHPDCLCDKCSQKSSVKVRHNQTLDLSRNYQELVMQYHPGVRRNLYRAALHAIQCKEDFISATDLMQMIYTSDKNKQNGYLNAASILALKNLLNAGSLVKTFSAHSADDSVHAALLVFLNDNNIYFFSFADIHARKYSACFSLIDLLIRKYAGSTYTLNFLGSDLPGVAYRNCGFGAITIPYYFLSINRLSKPVTGLIQLMRTFGYHSHTVINSSNNI